MIFDKHFLFFFSFGLLYITSYRSVKMFVLHRDQFLCGSAYTHATVIILPCHFLWLLVNVDICVCCVYVCLYDLLCIYTLSNDNVRLSERYLRLQFIIDR